MRHIKSIIQDAKECYICRLEADKQGYTGELTDRGLEDHHIIFSTANKPISEKYGLKVFLCLLHHQDHKEGVHHNKTLNLFLRKLAQGKYEESYSRAEFMELFEENWL